VDYAHIWDRAIDSTHDDDDHSTGSRKVDDHLRARKDHQEGDGGEPEVSQWLQESLDNFVRQGISDQEGDGGEPEVSQWLQEKAERPKVTGDHHDNSSPRGRPGHVRELRHGGID
jgi:hypothetical protein